MVLPLGTFDLLRRKQWLALLAAVALAGCGGSGGGSGGTVPATTSTSTPPAPVPTPAPTDSGAPYILYTDLLSGPTRGGENNRGVYLSLFGKNFGSGGLGTTTRVYINDAEVDNYRGLGVARGRDDIQQLTVQVGALGNPTPGVALPVKVVVNGVVSNTNHTFTVQPGDILFVDNVNGNDASAVRNDITRPWRYVQTATRGGALGAAQAGDVVVMRGRGTVWSDIGFDNRFARFRYKDGTAPTGAVGSGPITIVGYPGEDVHIRVASGSNGGFHGTNADPADGDWITLANLRIEGGDATVRDGPINLQADAGNWRIVNNELFGWAASDGSQRDGAGNLIPEARAGGIAGNGVNVAILGNHIHDIDGGTLNHCIYLDTGATNVEIAWNHIHHCHGGNIIQTFDNLGTANLNNVTVHHNRLHDGNRYGLNISNGTNSLQAWNNVIYNTDFAGVRFSLSGVTLDVRLYHNTLYNTNRTTGGDARAPVVNSWNLTQGLVELKHNIIAAGSGATSYNANYGSGSARFERNLYFGRNAGAALSQDSSPVGGNTDLNDPHFADTSIGNFRLLTGSPAIDQATATMGYSVNSDYDNNSRSHGAAPDVGAFEQF